MSASHPAAASQLRLLVIPVRKDQEPRLHDLTDLRFAACRRVQIGWLPGSQWPDQYRH